MAVEIVVHKAVSYTHLKIPVMDFGFMEWTQNQNNGLLWPNGQNKEQQNHEERYKDVTIVVAPGQEEAYLQSLEQREMCIRDRTGRLIVQDNSEGYPQYEIGLEPFNFEKIISILECS